MTFTLAPLAGGTRVEVRHAGLPDPVVPEHAYGWSHFLPRLAAAAHGEALERDDWVPLGSTNER